MKRLWLYGMLVFGSVPALWAQVPAHVTLQCHSLRFPPAQSGAQSLAFTTDPNMNEVNNELTPTFDPTLPTYGALFVLNDPTTASTITGQIFFDQPPMSDADNDGFDDFLEVSQAVAPATAAGLFTTAVDRGTVRADWSRAAGSSVGTCKIQMKGEAFGELSPFTFQFELVSYAGTLTYTTSTNAVTGVLDLKGVPDSARALLGTLSLVRVPGTNRFNDLTLLAGTLTNATGEVLSFRTEDMQRDVERQTNYFGYLDFMDGDLSTGTLDFRSWVLSIDDVNDLNGNGIPDLSDDPSPAVSTRPKLELARAANQLLLTVNAGSGLTYDLQETIALGQTNWTTTGSITVTNDAQAVALPLPPSTTKFWRLRRH